MVKVHKILHKQYLDNRKDASWMLDNYIPFLTDIELINVNKESLFHQAKECKANTFYLHLWLEICDRMKWQAVNNAKGVIVDIDKDQSVTSYAEPNFVLPAQDNRMLKTGI